MPLPIKTLLGISKQYARYSIRSPLAKVVFWLGFFLYAVPKYYYHRRKNNTTPR